MEQMPQKQQGFYSDLSSFNDTVLDISESTKDFFFKRHPTYTRVLILITILLEIPSLFLVLFFGLPALLLPLAIPLYTYWRVQKRMKHLFFIQLASILGMTYEPTSDKTTVSGYFFDIGHSNHLGHILCGAYEGVPIRLYEYQFATGSGKSKRTNHFVVSEIDTRGNLPHVFMKPDGFSIFGKPPGTKLLSLEGNFNDHFDVYVPEDSEIEALRILEPDVMITFIDEFSAFGFECFGTKTYIFQCGTFSDNRESLTKQITLLERLYDELVPELKGVARS